jgi:hypothetical protein
MNFVTANNVASFQHSEAKSKKYLSLLMILWIGWASSFVCSQEMG